MAHILPPKDIRGFEQIRAKGSTRKRWRDKSGFIWEWDSQHGRLEKYDKRGNHLGEFDLEFNQTKVADPKRKIEV